MKSVFPSFEANHDQWLTLSLSPPSQPQPQPQPQQRPQPNLLPLLQTQPQQPSLPATLHYMPLMAPPRPFSLPPDQESRQDRDFLLPPSQEDQHQDASQTSQGHKRRPPVRAKMKGKTETIDPPFAWATTTRATVHSLEHLLAQNIKSISGTVKCKGCHEQYDIEFELQEKFHEVARFVVRNKCNMHDRAPRAWTSPVLPTCKLCGQEDMLRPVINKKRNTNWLFLLLGQMLGCCKLSHLKYFCKHTMNHSTAAKDRLVYLTYLGLCKQLQPQGPFDP